MHGVKLKPETAARLTRLAETRGQTLDQLAERALNDYLDRHEPDPEFAEQLQRAAAEPPDDEIEAIAWRTINRLK